MNLTTGHGWLATPKHGAAAMNRHVRKIEEARRLEARIVPASWQTYDEREQAEATGVQPTMETTTTTKGEQYGLVVVEILKLYGCGISRPALYDEFCKRTGPSSSWGDFFEREKAFKGGLSWARKRSLIIPDTRRHRGQLSYWRYCGDED